MISDARKSQLQDIFDRMKPGSMVDVSDFTHEELSYLCSLTQKKEEMDKYMIIIDNGLPIGFNNIVEAKCKCEKAIEAGCNKATIYEKKFVASVVKPKVEFKEV